MTAPTIEPIIIGLGGNIGSEVAITGRFQRVRDALGELGDLRAAPLYRSAAIGPAQDRYLNSALWLRVDLQPVALLAVMQELEHLLGRDREREVRWGPRLIDLDLLVWGSRVLRTPELEVPHPHLAERKFALAPLVDLVGEMVIPRIGPARAALARVADQQVEQIAQRW